jgi:20S proteasome subunit alpha 5
VEATAQAICDLSLRFGEEGSKGEKMSRPFGVALLLGGVDRGVPSLYHCDPSGTFIPSEAKAIGSGAEGAQAGLEEHYHQVWNVCQRC